jgi:tRNA A37 threonylcarbamoyladenosine biosynthesis protein TsaE
MAEVADLAIAELADDKDAVVLVEWGDVVAAGLGHDLLTVRLQPTEVERPEQRVITVSGAGDRWADRWPRVQAALAAWVG